MDIHIIMKFLYYFLSKKPHVLTDFEVVLSQACSLDCVILQQLFNVSCYQNFLIRLENHKKYCLKMSFQDVSRRIFNEVIQISISL